ncbi:MAG: putative DNA binding domain-containing protein, partial [Burkholderiales bacterium]|nr:putative DNA binding domain-containing protein [Burkholderiales bacterium]
MEFVASIDIDKLLNLGELEKIEFKSSFNDEAVESIVAFANTNGGVVLLGFNNDGKCVGIDLGNKTLEDIAEKIKNTTDPRPQISILPMQYHHKSVVLITVEPVILNPINFRGRYFRRVGKTNQRMSNDEIIHRLSLSNDFSWDSYIESTSSLSDLNTNQINTFVDMVRNTGRHPVPKNVSDLDFLRKINLIIDDNPTRASLLLFSNNPEKYFGSAYLKLGRFRSPTLIVDDREIHGTLLQQLDDTMGWFRERLQTEFVITGKPQRDVIWEYPLNAIREAVVNLLCHRDYKGLAHSQIRLYDDRLEFWNDGGLPIGLSTEMLFVAHNSIPRNKIIAQAFFYAGLIEKWGSGTNRITEELIHQNHPLPQFTSDNGKFRLYFYRAILPEVEKYVIKKYSEVLNVPIDNIDRESQFLKIGGGDRLMEKLAVQLQVQFSFIKVSDIYKFPS